MTVQLTELRLVQSSVCWDLQGVVGMAWGRLCCGATGDDCIRLTG